MTECQGCGAWNERHRTLCVLCGTPLAETDEWDATAELPPLPPLPDGGLASSMPSWLREEPAPAIERTEPEPVPAPVEPPQLGPRADPHTFLTDDDFPQWLRDLAAREPPRRQAVPEPVPAHIVAPTTESEPTAPVWTNWPDSAEIAPAPSAAAAPAPTAPVVAETIAQVTDEPETVPSTIPDERVPTAVAAPPAVTHRKLYPWETLLLVLLFLGVLVAALWVLVANGVFGPGV